MMQYRWKQTLSVAAFLAFHVITALCQTNPNLEQGLRPYGTYRGGDIDSVNMINGNLTLNIPLFSYPQRGKLRLDYGLVYNNKSYIPKTTCTPLNGCTDYWIWRGSGVTFAQRDGYQDTVTTQNPYPGDTVTIHTITSPDGSSHTMGNLSTGGTPMIQSVVLPDNSAWTFQYSTDNNGDLAKITFPTGGTISYTWIGFDHCSSPVPSRCQRR